MAPRKQGNTNDERTVEQGPPPDPSKALSAAIAMFDEGFDKLNLHGKIATISGHLSRIPKNGHNNFHNYDYVLEADLVEWVKYWLAAARILIYPTIREWRVEPVQGKDPRTDVLYEFHVVDGKTGESFTTDALGQGSDPRDKGSNKASTSAMKFAYMRLFNISSGEDAERDEKGDERAASGEVAPVTVSAAVANTGNVERGGRQEFTSGAQIRAISNKSNQLGLGATGLVGVIKKVIGTDVELPEGDAARSKAISDFLKTTKAEDAGKIIYALDESIKAAAPASDDDGEPV